MANNSAHIGCPATHRRLLGPLAARRLAALAAGDAGDEPWRPLVALGGEPDGSLESVTTFGALCSAADLDGAIAGLQRVLVPGGRLVVVEHVAHPGALGVLQRLAGPTWSASPLGCHVGHDVHGALRRAGFLLSELDRWTVPAVVPLLRHWVRGVARSPA